MAPYSHDNDVALVRCIDCCLHTRKMVVGITLATMYYYDGLSGRRKVYIVGYVVDEHPTAFDCQARAVDICCWEFWKRGGVASDV